MDRLNSETNAALADAEIRKKAEGVGLQLRGGMASAFGELIAGETRKWARIIKEAHITAE